MTHSEIIQTLEMEIAKANNELKCAHTDVEKANNRIKFCLTALHYLKNEDIQK